VLAANARLAIPRRRMRAGGTDLGSKQDCRDRLRVDLVLERERRGGSPGTIARGWMAWGRSERGGPRLVGEPERGANLERLGGAVNDAEQRVTDDRRVKPGGSRFLESSTATVDRTRVRANARS
jgi:hypothetical protein